MFVVQWGSFEHTQLSFETFHIHIDELIDNAMPTSYMAGLIHCQ